MSAPMGQIGGYRYESPEARRLGNINPQSYDYRDQTKTVAKLVNDVSYMAGMQRKMQKGIDEANQNFIQEIQAFINDILVLLGGGGDTGLDFGDLKYILQAIGALFGFEPGVPLPLNLFQAAWHFFSNYILPVGNFEEAINMIIDGAIATILDIFGEVPIVGQALQQLAQIISAIRDSLLPLIDAFEALLEALSIDWEDVENAILALFGPLRPIFDFLIAALDDVNLPNFVPVFNAIANWNQGIITALTTIITAFGTFIEIITGGDWDDLGSILEDLAGIFTLTGIGSGVNPVQWAINLITELLAPTGLLGGANWEELYEFLTGAAGGLEDLANFLLSGIFGQINPGRLSSIPLGAIANFSPNMLDTPSFSTAVSMPSGGNPEHDATDGHSSNGCAKFTADGEEHSIVSNWINVQQGQKIKMSAWVKWENLTVSSASQAPIRLVLRSYNGSTLVNAANVTGITNPSGNSSNSGQNNFVKLAEYEYTVPSNVTRILIQPTVTAVATGGTVKFDDGNVYVSGLLPMEFIGGLVESLLEKLNIDEWDDWLATAFSPLNSILNQIIDILRGIPTTPINSAVQGVKDWWQDTVNGITGAINNIQNTWNKIVGGYYRTTVTDQTEADVEEVMMTVGQEILVAQESTITLANQANAPKNVAYWETPNPFEDVSFPRSELVPVPTYALSGTTARANLGTLPANWTASVADDVEVHTHNINSLTVTTTWNRPLYTIPDGTLALSAVRIKQDRLVNIARFIAGGGTPPSTALYVGLYTIDPETGNMALVHNFGDIKGEISTGSGIYETPCELPADVLVDAGTLFAVGILPVGGSFSVAAIRRQPITTSALIYPRAATELLTGQSSLPSTISESALNHTSTHRIWVSVGQAVESTPEDNSPVTLSMTFDVANTSNWSSPSFQQFGTSGSRFGIDGGAIYCASDLLALGEEVHWRSALCLTPVHTNDHSASIVLDTQFNANTYGYTTTRAYVRCNSSGTSGVAMHLDSNSAGNLRIRIANISNMTSLGTVRATATTTFSPGDEIEIRAIGSLYKVYKNGVAVPGAEWDDTTEIVPIGKAWRRHGFGLGNRNVSAFTTYRTAYVDRYRAMDLVP
ncbi:minor tail protein [Mycobacterium phage Madruga]|uniref:Minor tail protein n=1 Tax=Mycobacterium phage Madruga TaxID=1675552 RepID=A0A0K1LT61_9CAUD|nr:minor tail protein [Mycobacterium phage Madruga]